MIINRSHLPWAVLIAAATFVLWIVYREVIRPGSIPEYIPVPDSLGRAPFGHRSVGATPLGLIYGTVAFLIFSFAALLSARKKVRHWRVGRAEAWMRAHIWLSVLTIPLVAFHCGIHSGSGMTTGLLILYAIVMVSGFYGLALQQFIPRQMMDRLAHEVIYDQIPFLRAQLVESVLDLRRDMAVATVPADVSTEQGRGALREALDRDILPYLRANNGRRYLLDNKQAATNLFLVLKSSVCEENRAHVDAMRAWCEQRRQMDLQSRLQHWLHYWLFVHVPASLLLLLWTAWHAVTGLFYF